jgi:Fe-Mn family superoxide dismutase
MERKYSLPELPFGYKELEPYISEEQLKVHHDKHYAAYVNGANKILEKFDSLRKKKESTDIKAAVKELSWQIGGHILHSLYWENLAGKSSPPNGAIKKEIEKEFSGLERLRHEFTDAAKSVERSGWTALTYCTKTSRLLIMQIEKHNTNIYPTFGIILVMDMFEHAYYIDYKNDKAKYIEAFWNIINWDEVNRRLEMITG